MSRAGPSPTEGVGQNNPPYPGHGDLLSTKLFVPPLRPKRVSRPRLIEQINMGLDKALILISAPAGYGKTTLASSWVHESKLPSSWLSLDEAENDPVRFRQNFLAALQKVAPAIQKGLLSQFQSSTPAQDNSLLNILINEISADSAPFILILDDFHVIQNQAILDMLAFLLEHRPPQLHLLLITRTDPLLPLFRLRARDQLVEIRADHLSFTEQEITSLLNEILELRLSTDDITSMQARTEGWIAGLQLAALSMQGRKDLHSFISAFTGSHHYIMDYLTEEVLKLQPENIRTFLLHTSILTSMCGSLCDAVVDSDEVENVNGQAMLEKLEAMNLFVIPLDDRRQWYRYHHLFADVVNQRLKHLFPEKLPELHRRASRWYEQNDMISDAIRHALLAGDQEHGAHLVDQYGCDLLMRGEVVNLLDWIKAVEPYSKTLPWIAIQEAWSLCLTGQLERSEEAILTAERLVSELEVSDSTRTMSGAVIAAQAYRVSMQGDSHLAADLARQALDCLPASSDFSCSLRSAATSILGDTSWINGNLPEAERAYADAVQIGHAASNVYMTMIVSSNLADVYLEQGELHKAARILTDTLESATRPDGQALPLSDRIFAGLGQIYYEWNDLESADQAIHRSIQLSRQYGNLDLLAKGYAMLAWQERARGNHLIAQEAMNSAEHLLQEQRLSPRQSLRVKLASAHWWIAQGSWERAFQLVQQLGISVGDEISYPRGHEYLLFLRLLLAQGEYDAALSLSDRLLQLAESGKRMGKVIELLSLQALIFQGKKEFDRALAVLDRALSIAQSEGFARTFLDEGEPMMKLLYLLKSRPGGSWYSSKLLSQTGRVTGTQPPSAQLLIEQLTSRELEVLKLIEAGCTNQDIADTLVISIPTVKRHISNIYAKLGAKNRTQAVSFGRELNLFN